MTDPTYDLVEYAFYDEGTEDGSIIIGTSNNQQTLDVDTYYQCRFQIHNDNSKSYNNIVWTFEYNHEGNGWNDVTTSVAPIQAVDDDDLIDGDNCTNRLTSRAVFYAPNNVTEDGTIAPYNHGATYYTEILLSFQIPAGQVSDGDEILIRARESSNDFVVTYTVTGDIDVSKGGTAYQRSVTDTVGVTDTVTNVREIFETIADTVGITDAVTTVRELYKTITDDVGITDTLATVTGKVATIADTVGVTDTIANVRELYKTLTDSVGITDTLTTVREIYKTLSDTVGVTDTLTVIRELYKTIANAVGVTDTVSTARGVFKTISDAVGITDVIETITGKAVAIQDSVGITDTVSTVRELFISLLESVGITDTVEGKAASREVLFIEGFDWSSDVNDWVDYKGWNAVGGGSAITGRGGVGYALDNPSPWLYSFLDVEEAITELTVGVAIKTPSTWGNGKFFEISELSTAHPVLHFNSDNTLDLYRGNTLLDTSTETFSSNSWIYIEIYARISSIPLYGRYKVIVDGDVIFDYTGNTDAGAEGNVNRIVFNNTGGAIAVDDIYIIQNIGEDFLGDVRVGSLLPDGAGSSTQWTPLSGNNWENVDDTDIDGDTTYVSTSGVGNLDLYTFNDIVASGAINIHAVQLSAGVRKTNEAESKITGLIIRPESTNYLVASGIVSTSYKYLSHIMQNNPETSSGWTVAEVNASEFGIRVES